MAFIGSADSTGNGSGPLYYSLTADITALNAGSQAYLATIKLGTTAIVRETGAAYVLRNNAGTLSFVIVS